jgi:hypothetical protein
MSKFGMKVGNETVYGVVSPDHALDLIEKVVAQYFGEFWTQHKPRCPLCDTALSDTEKHMNRPVGECTNPKCDSTIHIADFFGKIKDVLGEWTMVKDDWMEKAKAELQKKSQRVSLSTDDYTPTGSATNDNFGSDIGEYSEGDLAVVIDEKTVFIW